MRRLTLAHALIAVVSIALVAGACSDRASAASGGAAGSPPVPADPDAPAPPLPPVTFSYPRTPQPEPPSRRIHPSVRILAENGRPVAESGGPLSLAKTCGACHDAEYIAAHDYHAQVGLDEMVAPGTAASGRPWDTSPGMFGRWNPLTYRVLTPPGAARLDMGTADWIRIMGPRHVGGGPAVWSRIDGRRLDERRPASAKGIDPDAVVLDPVTGEPRAWDWRQSGTAELDCLLCHLDGPNNVERIHEIEEGRFRWASTATLVGSGIVERRGEKLAWVPEAFDASGQAKRELFAISEPQSSNCRQCHGRACRCTDPVVFESSLQNWGVETTGEVFSAGRMFDSGMNLAGKESLSLPWDVHAARLLQCTDCHGSPNNPRSNAKEEAASRPSHLAFDSRRLGESDYLVRPDHDLGKGHTAQGTVGRRFNGSMRDCRDCHDAVAVHDFLPYKELHFEKLSCQTCHIPKVVAPVRSVTDWTVITADGSPAVEHRGVDGPINDPTSLITGYAPVLLEHDESEGVQRLGPHNLIVSWWWVGGEPAAPVRLADLEAAYLTPSGRYRREIVAALDADRNGGITADELELDTAAKVAAVRARLESVGVVDPRIEGEIQPFTLSHGVASRGWALGSCEACHSRASRVLEPVRLASTVPGGVLPRLVGDANVRLMGDLVLDAQGGLDYRPKLDPKGLYIHGADHVRFLDTLGIAILVASVVGIGVHGGGRIISARRRQTKGNG